MKRLLLALGLMIGTMPVYAQAPPTPPAVSVVCNAQTLAVTGTSANVALTTAPDAACDAVTILNDGATEVFVAMGGSAVAALTTTGIPIPTGKSITMWANGTYVAAITSTSTSTIRIIQANGEFAYR